jgi:ubiquinone/menaquinone biosynthesis C-methylase UbiE
MDAAKGRNEWWLDERAHAGAEHLDGAFVSGYDRKAAYDPTEDVDALVAHGVAEKSVVLDLAAGTGTFTIAAAAVCGQVIAVDVSPAMTSALRRRVDEARVRNVTVVEAGFLSYEHDGPAVDAVFTRNALHQLPDFWKGIALQRIASLLRPGGVLRVRDLVFDFPPAEADDRITAWLAGAVDDAAVGYTRDELAEHVRTEFSTYSWLLDVILDRTGFDVVERSFRRHAYGTYTALRRNVNGCA